MSIHVGIYLFDDVEVLDFAGPFEVFSKASNLIWRDDPQAEPPFIVHTLSEDGQAVRARGGLEVNVQHSLSQHPTIDLLLIPGGVVNAEMEKPSVIEWIQTSSASAQLTASVCTGAFLLAQAGLLTGRKVITHWEDVADLRAAFPDLEVIEGYRWVDSGDVVTSAGISAGIDMSLHLVSRLANPALAERTARQMDFDWHNQGLDAPLA